MESRTCTEVQSVVVVFSFRRRAWQVNIMHPRLFTRFGPAPARDRRYTRGCFESRQCRLDVTPAACRSTQRSAQLFRWEITCNKPSHSQGHQKLTDASQCSLRCQCVVTTASRGVDMMDSSMPLVDGQTETSYERDCLCLPSDVQPKFLQFLSHASIRCKSISPLPPPSRSCQHLIVGLTLKVHDCH